MRAVHGSTVLYPCDANQTARLVGLMAELPGISYLRTTREKTPILYTDRLDDFRVGGSRIVRGGEPDDAVAVIAAGITVHEAIKAADELKATITRARDRRLLASSRSTRRRWSTRCARPAAGCASSRTTGPRAASATRCSRRSPKAGVAHELARFVHLAVRDMPGSGKPAELLDAAGISARHIARRGEGARALPQEGDDAARDDRARPHGRQHGAAPDARRPRVRRLRPDARSAVQALAGEGAVGRRVARRLRRAAREAAAVWLMVPAAVVDATLDELVPLLAAGRHRHRRRQLLLPRRHRRARSGSPARGLHYVDCGTSGGVWGLERGYCLMIGGEADVVRRLDPLFATLAPGAGDVAAHARARASAAARPSRATCTAARTAPATSSRWCTTASSTA